MVWCWGGGPGGEGREGGRKGGREGGSGLIYRYDNEEEGKPSFVPSLPHPGPASEEDNLLSPSLPT